jgi:hypothetical protein
MYVSKHVGIVMLMINQFKNLRSSRLYCDNIQYRGIVRHVVSIITSCFYILKLCTLARTILTRNERVTDEL